ncbi:MAG: methyltransferase domain-containing protein [Pseudomonadota bacterium]
MVKSANEEQIDYWNSAAGRKWVILQEQIDEVLGSLNHPLLAKAQPSAGESVLDVGCGTGAFTMALGHQVGASGQVLGLDIAAPLLERAEQRRQAAGMDQLCYRQADAQTHSFDGRSLDLIASRFGVMFFDDPVAAFANMRQALRPGGRLYFASWSALADNPWFKVPHDAAVAQLGQGSPAPPRAPGPMAFAEIDYVRDILEEAGFIEVGGQPETIFLVKDAPLDQVAHLACQLGPVSRLMRELEGTEADLSAIVEAVKEGFRPYDSDVGVKVPARLNFFSGRNS